MKAVQLSLFKPASQLDLVLKDGCIMAYDEDALIISKVCRIRLEPGSRTKVIFPLVGEYTYFPKLVRAGYKLHLL